MAGVDIPADNDSGYISATIFSPGVDKPEGITVFLGVLLFVLSAVTIIGNVATILAFRKSRELRRRTSNLLIFSLSCSDLLIGATGLPFAATTCSLGDWPLGKPVCIIGAFFSVVGVCGGMYTVTAINIDRWLLVSREYTTYLRIQSPRNIKLQIAAAWTLAFLISSCESLIWVSGGARKVEASIDFTMECRSPVRTDLRFAFVIGVLLFLIPFAIMLLCSLRFVVLLRRRLRKPSPKISSSSIASSPSTDEKGDGSRKETPPASPVESQPQPTGSDVTSTVATASDSSYSRPNTSLPSAGKRSSVHVREHPRTKTHARKMKNRYMKPAIRLAILMSVFMLCSLPYPFFVIIADTTCEDCDSLRVARNHLSNLLLANSALNPFLYAIMHRKIRQFHAQIFNAMFCRQKRNVSI
ncbi:D(2) dopamine receptor-like [Acanthaster planci]|uniref:D(2) dopamine receptor-like n=1 Tax=Acanthaster planci TaxID=133434 RepID=A0A8B7XN57_ACAPL|nr:D(2) dopamine receptor-like [Acanthaster planci]